MKIIREGCDVCGKNLGPPEEMTAMHVSCGEQTAALFVCDPCKTKIESLGDRELSLTRRAYSLILDAFFGSIDMPAGDMPADLEQVTS